MVMEICNNNFIIAIYSCKMGTCNKDEKKYEMTITTKNDYDNIAVMKQYIT